MNARTTTVLIADCSTWPERLGRDLRFGYQLTPTMSSVDETVSFMESSPVSGDRSDDGAPDLIVADLDLPGGGAVELCRRLPVPVPLLVVTYSHGQEAVLDAVAEGACGYIVRAADVESTQIAMARAIIGEPVINSSLAGLILSHFRSADDSDGLKLTPVERRIVQLTARNYGLSELTDTVQMSVAEVEDSMRVLFDKLRRSRRALLAGRS